MNAVVDYVCLVAKLLSAYAGPTVQPLIMLVSSDQ